MNPQHKSTCLCPSHLPASMPTAHPDDEGCMTPPTRALSQFSLYFFNDPCTLHESCTRTAPSHLPSSSLVSKSVELQETTFKVGYSSFMTGPIALEVQTQIGSPRALPSAISVIGKSGGAFFTRKATRFAAYPLITTRMNNDQPNNRNRPGNVRGAGPPPPVKRRIAPKQATLALLMLDSRSRSLPSSLFSMIQ